jgi:hypothetical protein
MKELMKKDKNNIDDKTSAADWYILAWAFVVAWTLAIVSMH